MRRNPVGIPSHFAPVSGAFRTVLPALLLVALLVAAPSPLRAQPPEGYDFQVATPSPPRVQSTEDCDTYSDAGERLKCKHARLVTKQGQMVQTLRAEYSENMSESELRSMDRLDKQQRRSERAEQRLTARHFRLLGRKHNTICDTKELLGDGEGDEDGICEGNEPCEEIIGDQIGNERQPCETRGNKKEREICVEICGDGADPGLFGDTGANADDDLDASLIEDLDNAYDDLTQQLDDVNELLEENADGFRALAASLRGLDTPADACLYSADWQSYVVPTLAGVKFAKETARSVADVLERGCDQSWLGNNGSVLCTGAEIVAGLLNVATAVFEGVVTGLQANLQDDTGACLQVMSSDLREVKITSSASAEGTAGLVTALALHEGSLSTHDRSLADHDDALTAHDGALRAHDGDMEAAVEALSAALAMLQQEQDAAFRADIEGALSRMECVPSLWLPGAHGGRLEMVRNHVADLIERAAGSGAQGADTVLASKHVEAADRLIDRGDYLKGCQRLAMAVQALTK